MAKKNEETTKAPNSVPAEQPDTTPAAAPQADTPKTAEANKSGFYIYIGPNIKGLIQTGTIYRGNRDNAYKMAAAAIEKQPKVKSLIVSGDALPEARLKIKTPGNVLYTNYNELKNPAGK